MVQTSTVRRLAAAAILATTILAASTKAEARCDDCWAGGGVVEALIKGQRPMSGRALYQGGWGYAPLYYGYGGYGYGYNFSEYPPLLYYRSAYAPPSYPPGYYVPARYIRNSPYYRVPGYYVPPDQRYARRRY